MTAEPRKRTRFILNFEPTPSCEDPVRALRALLKRALRDWGLRCTHAIED
jgi:hypothetical protein